jgi:DNA-binding response OmpR family regulator
MNQRDFLVVFKYVVITKTSVNRCTMRSHERERSAAPHGASAVHPLDRPGRVLVVDDEPNVRLVFRTALESEGHRVDEAADGSAALDHLRGTPGDVVLLDLQMPGVGGMEVRRRLRDEGNDVPVVIVTAHGSIPDAVEAMKLGAVDFLSKPLTPEALRRVVSEVIERHAPAGQAPGPESDQPEHPAVVTLWPTVIDLSPVKLALNRRDFDRAETLLEQALDIAPGSAEALTLMGVLRESRGQDHAAYQAYRQALQANPHYAPARDNLRRYCERFGLDPDNPRINPAAGP